MNKKRKYGFLIILVVVAFGGFVYSSLNVLTALKSIDQALRIIRDYYVNEVDLSKLLDHAIEAITDSLDTHTTYLKKEDYEDLMIHTEGEFGGLGIQISKRGDYITIISPIEGTPAYDAGLIQGDKIVKIEGISTKDMKLDKAVSMMRGKPGTDVTITVSRGDLDKTKDFTITRAIIKIKSVSYAGLLKNDVGYIVLNSFSKSTAGELKKALDSLISVGASKFILDLRNNSGGILDGAVDVSSFFIEKGKEVVYTEGRTVHESFRSDDGSYSKYPLVVLVSPFSASASEIVAGAVQDWDRGFLIGERTFGKGSVQRLYPLQSDRAIKLTIARYHTPSGRCIDKELVGDTTKVYHTRGPLHRTVKGGGGIVPDSVVKVRVSLIYEKIYSYSFDFIVEYLAKHPDIETVTSDMLEEFKVKVKKSLKKDSVGIRDELEYIEDFPESENLTPEMTKEFIMRVKEYLKDDSRKTAEFSETEWNSSLDEIKRGLKVRLAYNKRGLRGMYEASIPDDEEVKVALGILKKARVPREVFAGKK
jgi:carboxyl-terminal processing protease